MHLSNTDRRGQALIESVIVIPVLVIVVTTIFWFSRVVLTRQQLLAASRYGTDLIVYTTLGDTAIKEGITSFLCTSSRGGRTLDPGRLHIELKIDRFPEITEQNALTLLPMFSAPWDHLSSVTVSYDFSVPPIIAAFSYFIPANGFEKDIRVSGHSEVLAGTGCKEK